MIGWIIRWVLAGADKQGVNDLSRWKGFGGNLSRPAVLSPTKPKGAE